MNDSMDKQTQPSQTSLGAQLAKIKAESELEKLRREARQRAEEDEKFRDQLESVVAFFTGAQAHIVTALASGREPKPYVLGNTGQLSQHYDAYSALQGYQSTPLQTVLDGGRNAFCAPWLDFKEWAQANELEVALKSAHDGVGIHGWYELEVTPAANLK